MLAGRESMRRLGPPGSFAVEKAFKDAVDRALCRISNEPFERLKAEGSAEAARRINRAMVELKKLTKGWDRPDYGNPDVALFYAQWYLPQQVNVTYSESARILGQSTLPSKSTLQLVDYGAGTGAMVIGLSLAIATHVRRKHWPKLIEVYQIDRREMLKFGHAIWNAIFEETRSRPALRGLMAVMKRMQFKDRPLDDKLADVPTVDAERWLTAIHVAYEGSMATICGDVQALRDRLDPHVMIRTAPAFKMPLLERCRASKEDAHPIKLLLDDSVSGMTERRGRFLAELLQSLDGDRSVALQGQPEDLLRYPNGPVQWKDVRERKEPFAETVWAVEAERHA